MTTRCLAAILSADVVGFSSTMEPNIGMKVARQFGLLSEVAARPQMLFNSP